MIVDHVRREGIDFRIESISFQGTQITIASDSSVDARIEFFRDKKVTSLDISTAGDHFLSFHDFGFSGFQQEEIGFRILVSGSVTDEHTLVLSRLPMVPFIREPDPDHHDSFFFLGNCPNYAIYGRRDTAHFPHNGVYLISSDVIQDGILKSLTDLSDEILDKLRTRKSLIYIDQSNEGNPFDHIFAWNLHRQLAELRIDPDLIFFANHCFNWKKKYKTWAAACDIRNQINVVYSNWYADGLMFHSRDMFDAWGGIDNYVERQRLRAFSPIVRPKRFMSMNYTPRPHRVLLMLKLFRDKYIDHGHISFGGIRNSDMYKPNFFELNGLSQISELGFGDLLDSITDLENLGTMTLDQKFSSGVEGEAIRMSSRIGGHHYEDSYFSVVTESEMIINSDFQRVTEKIYKPLMRLHPLLVLGNAGSLEIIRAQGYRTFSDFFDESYDSEISVPRRIEKVFSQIDAVMKLSSHDLAERYRAAWPVLEHNLYCAHGYMTDGLRRGKREILDTLYTKLRSLG